LVAVQNLADLENIQCLCSEVCPASSHDAYQAISIQTEILSYAEEEYPVPITLPGIKPEPVFMLGGFHNYRYPVLQTLIHKRFLFTKAEKLCRSKISLAIFFSPANPVSFVLVLHHRTPRIYNC
jgi:hypothetical protein